MKAGDPKVDQRALAVWAAESFAIGLFLLGFRDILSNFITIIIANTFFIFALVFYFEGSRRFLFVSEKIHPLSIMAIIFQIGSFIYFTYSLPSVNNRIISISITAAIISFYCVGLFIRDQPVYWKTSGIMLKFIFFGYGSYQLLRIIWTINENNINSFMSAGNFHSLAFIFIVFLVTGTTFGFIWMVSKKLEFELTSLAEFDELCQILNRRGVNVFADREISKVKRIGGYLTIMMVDLDHLKKINDQFGHTIGDQVLQAFSNCVNTVLRPYDIFGRIGGDEFIVVLPHTSLEQSLKIAERIRFRIEESVFEISKQKIKLTASFGLTTSNSKQIEFEEMITLADEALYQSKNKGRNQVTHYSQIPEKIEK